MPEIKAESAIYSKIPLETQYFLHTFAYKIKTHNYVNWKTIRKRSHIKRIRI